jgi:hypothetical protein
LFSPDLTSFSVEAVGRRDVVTCDCSGLYILADGWDPSPFRHFASKVEGQSGWRVIKMPCSHDVMVDMPGELAAELLKLV